ncbi:MAG TPA: cytochrome C oxidase subunit III [Lentisphaeria bacterium]|nr:cytochrome C oxidase subunit III [Lentisphaeria bacterium]
MSATTHDSHGHPRLAHHFFEMEQQHECAKLGMWLFLLTEILFFGGLFCFYFIWRIMDPELFVGASEMLNWKLGGLNTIVLIFSSFTVAMAIRSIQQNKRNACAIYLAITIACAFVFLVVKYFEYSAKIGHGTLPGTSFHDLHFLAEHPEVKNPHIFFSIYFCMTGLHGFHVICGIVYIAWLLYLTLKNRFDSEYYAPIEMGGLYWHLVDLIWIYLFPLLYLI